MEISESHEREIVSNFIRKNWELVDANDQKMLLLAGFSLNEE